MSKSHVASSAVELLAHLAVARHRQIEVDDVAGRDRYDRFARVVPVVVDAAPVDRVLRAHAASSSIQATARTGQPERPGISGGSAANRTLRPRIRSRFVSPSIT